jgi:putative MATE family efflux protein
VVRAEGNAKVAMYTMLIGAGLNILLDPIFIFWLDMGVKGAAIATVISQFIGMMSLIYYFAHGSSVLEFSGIGLDRGILKEVFSVGLATFTRNGSASVVMLLLNNVLGVYGGDMAIAVYGIFNRLFMFSAMPIVGLIQGMQPILAFNYGAGQYARVRDTVMLCAGLATAISALGFLIMFLFPQHLFAIFSEDVDLIGSGAGATRIMVLMMPLLGFQFVVGAMYQALGKARPALILSVTRQVVFLIPFVLILPYYFGLAGVWMSFPVSDLLTFVLTLFFFSKEYRVLG